MRFRHFTLFALTAMLSGSMAYAQEQRAKQQKPDRGPKVQFEVSDNVKVVRDLVYTKYGDREVKLDLYLPKKPSGDAIPCIMVIHGGGWRAGNKQTFAPHAAFLAEHGFAAACIGYRLLPEVQFPAPIKDCKAAVRWVRANADEYGIDPGRIGAIGGSAGGHLVAMLGTSHKVTELEGDGPNQGVSSRVQAVVGMAAPSSMTRYAQRTGASRKMAELISPVTHVDADSAPILLIHSDADGTVPHQQSVDMEAKCRAEGVPAKLHTVKNGPHAFWNFERWFNDTMDLSINFFRETLPGVQ